MENKKCSFCGEKESIEEFSKCGQYNSPWDKEPSENAYCSEECLQNSENSYYSDYSYQYCEHCGKNIIVRCPSNGWREYFHYENGECFCVKCYQDFILENGIDSEKFEGGKIAGDFFDDEDLKKAGYKQESEFFISGSNSIKEYCALALKFIKAGFKVVTNYERLSIIGDEGSITLWLKGE